MNKSKITLKPANLKHENLWVITSAAKRLLHKPLSNISKRKRRNYRNMASLGSSIFHLPASQRLQRCTVKIAYTKNTKSRSWTAHGTYLQREDAQLEHVTGLGFNHQYSAIDIAKELDDWQKAKDPHFFKVIIAPEEAHRLDLKEHVIVLMKTIEKDIGTRLQWIAIDHHNTDHDHIHLLIRGIDDQGKPLTLDKNYISQGIRNRSQTLLTNELGLRTFHEKLNARSRQIEKNHVTEIDRSLRHKAIDGQISFEDKVPAHIASRSKRLQEITRLKYLETLGLATQVSKKTWRISEDLERTLQELQLSNDIIKSQARHGIVVRDFKNLLRPTEITQQKPLIGRVVAMGLEQELYDKRYLLIEDDAGKSHYIKANNSVIKARDQKYFRNGDKVELSLKSFINGQGETIHYTHVKVLQQRALKRDNKQKSLTLEISHCET